MLYPLVFNPIFKERVWGGRRLEQLYQKPLPSDIPIGESWEISDRPGDVSTVAQGPLAGRDLRWLMTHHQKELLGSAQPQAGRFPLLIKILDAREKLSLQVHPPAARAAELSGEPKTEMWYIASAEPGAELFTGLRRGVTRAEFEGKIRDGSVAECFHRIAVRPGDAMFLPSGRVHAIGGGLVIFEIQQNSDTTYRVFDWNRVGLDGKPRALHIEQSLASIDFQDFEPALAGTAPAGDAGIKSRALVRDPLFNVDADRLGAHDRLALSPGQMHIIGVVTGGLKVRSGPQDVPLRAGQFCLVPACLTGVVLEAGEETTFLLVTPGPG